MNFFVVIYAFSLDEVKNFDKRKFQTVVINEDVILTIFLGENMSPNEDIAIFIRNSQGKFVWQGELIYKFFPDKNYEPFKDYETFPFKTNSEINDNLRFYWKDESKKPETENFVEKEKNLEDQTSINNLPYNDSILDEMIEKQFEIERVKIND